MAEVISDPSNPNEAVSEDPTSASNGLSRLDSDSSDLFESQTEDLHKLHVSDGDFHTRASICADGRININILQNSHHLSSHVVPTLQSFVKATAEPPPPSLDSLPSSMTGKDDGHPPPPMNIVIHVVGSRGDVQPFVSLGKVLREKYGHRVRLATHPTFKTFVEENGLEFFSIGGDPAELMAFMVKNPGLMPGVDSLKNGDVGKRRRGMYEIVKGCWRSCIESGNGMDETTEQPDPQKIDRPFVADAIIANPPSFAHIHCAERLGVPLHLMFTMPWSPTQCFPHPLTTIHSSNAEPNMTNLVSYALVEMMTWQGLGDVMNRFRKRTLGLEPVSLMWAPGMTSRLRIPFTYCWSPALIPKPEDWGGHIFVSGFYFLSLASSYTPDPKLVAFLEDGPPPVYIGFGSIVVEDPDAMTKLIFDAVKKSGVRALVSKGWGGFGGDELKIPDRIFMLGNVPHDWLFKHVSAVVHHGGAGTTAAGILAGRPTVVVPFFGDQPFWGAMTARAGAGPQPVPFKHLTADSLSAALMKALAPEALQKAKKLGESIAKEEGAEAGAQSFHRMLGIAKYRCSVSPDRVAVWRIKKTTIRLSALAAIVLGDEGLVDISDLKLYRPVEYDSEDGPWDPITGGASALLGTLSSLMVGIADIPVEIINGIKTSVQKSSEERAKANSTTPPASVSIPTSEKLIASETTSSTSSVISMPIATPDTDGDSIADNTVSSPQSPRVHKIDVTSVPRSKHSHTIEPGDDCSHKAAVRAEKGASAVAIGTIRIPMDFTLAVARGFHNAPKLYRDDTVRSPDKITDFQSGLKAAGKEFGYGWYDGISGLVTQPLHGAKKHGVKGFLEGVGKGIGGFLLKPSAGIWGLGGYTFKGIYKELQKNMGHSEQSYIIASRITQGHEDWDASTPTERLEIVENYRKVKEEHEKAALEMHRSHSHVDLLHNLHKDLSSISFHRSASSQSLEKSDNGHHKHHLLKHHMSHLHHSTSNLGDEKSDTESGEHLEHKHSLKHHLPHLHMHGKHANGTFEGLASESTDSLPGGLDKIPMVHEAEIRREMSI